MNRDVINYKTSEYIGRMGVAFHLGNQEKSRKEARTLLVLYRVQARDTVTQMVQNTAELRGLKRSLKKAEEAGIAFPTRSLEGHKGAYNAKRAVTHWAGSGRGRFPVPAAPTAADNGLPKHPGTGRRCRADCRSA